LVLQEFLRKFRNVGVSPCAYPSVNRATAGGCPYKNPQKSLKNQKFHSEYQMDKQSRLRIITRRILFFILFAVILTGCAGKKNAEKDTFFEEWKEIAEKSKGYSPAPGRDTVEPLKEKETVPPEESERGIAAPESDKKVSDIHENNRNIPVIAEKMLPDQKISMKMHNVEIALLLRTLARAADQNMIISENVKGKTSLNIKDSPWDEVFRCILKTYGLTYDWQGNIIRIITLEDIHNEMKILEANQQIDEKKRDKELKQLEAEQKRASKKREIEMVEPLTTRVVPVRFAEPANLKQNLEQFLTGDKDKKRGSIAVDEHTRSLIIQASQNDTDTMLSLIETLDRPSPQVLIEAHIVETNRDTARELGIQWGGLYHKENGNNNYWITPGTNSSTGSENINPAFGNIVNFPAVSAAETGMNVAYTAQKIGSYILSLQLSALQKEGKLNILSNPSITTIDNQRAVIESGKEIPYQTVEDDEVNTEFKEATLKLEVTPHVIDKNTLKMKIITQKKEVDTTVQDNPPIITKKAETTVVLFDGETTVIGGLSKESLIQSESGVPFLKDIPFLGYLFKGKGDNSNMEDVLIFITPYILEEKNRESGIEN